MTTAPLSPGVYIQEVPGGSRPIEAAGTAIAAFVGFTEKAPDDNPADPEARSPRFVANWTQFTNLYGGFAEDIMLPHAVYAWFNHGGGGAYIVRVPPGGSAAASSGSSSGSGGGRRKSSAPSGGADVHHVGAPAFIGDEAERTGINGLVVKEDVTMVVVPDLITATRDSDGNVDMETYQAVQVAAVAHCTKMANRMAILDAPPGLSPEKVRAWLAGANVGSMFSSVYYPWIKISNPLATPQAPSQPKTILVPPSGHVAGVWAGSDASRGVWKAPANETVLGALDVETEITTVEQGTLNPEGINVIRAFGTRGIRVWGARTTETDDASWRYINVRRLFNNIEVSIKDGTNWAVFEPNDRALWAKVKRTINAFLIGYWRAGALFGASASEAFFVKCDDENNPPESIDQGLLIIDVGIAPVKPAEFVVFRITQISGGREGGE